MADLLPETVENLVTGVRCVHYKARYSPRAHPVRLTPMSFFKRSPPQFGCLVLKTLRQWHESHSVFFFQRLTFTSICSGIALWIVWSSIGMVIVPFGLFKITFQDDSTERTRSDSSLKLYFKSIKWYRCPTFISVYNFTSMFFGSKGTLVEPIGGIIMGKCLNGLKSRFHRKNKGDSPLWCTHGGCLSQSCQSRWSLAANRKHF